MRNLKSSVLAGVAMLGTAGSAFATGGPEDIVSGLQTYYTGTLQAIQIAAVVAIFVVFLSIRLAKKAGRSAT